MFFPFKNLASARDRSPFLIFRGGDGSGGKNIRFLAPLFRPFFESFAAETLGFTSALVIFKRFARIKWYEERQLPISVYYLPWRRFDSPWKPFQSVIPIG